MSHILFHDYNLSESLGEPHFDTGLNSFGLPNVS